MTRYFRFQDRCIEMMYTDSVSDFTKRIVSFAEYLGFGSVSGVVITDHGPTLTEFQAITNVPSGYVNEFHNLTNAKLDPVSRHCKNSSLPIIWDQETYTKNDAESLWDFQATFGLKTGIAIGLHLPYGQHFMFGAEGTELPTRNARIMRDLVQGIRDFAAHAHAAAFELVGPKQHRRELTAGLTQSELEILRWSLIGKNPWEIGELMILPERVVVRRLGQAMKKLNCTTKYAAVIKALRLHLIEH